MNSLGVFQRSKGEIRHNQGYLFWISKALSKCYRHLALLSLLLALPKIEHGGIGKNEALCTGVILALTEDTF